MSTEATQGPTQQVGGRTLNTGTVQPDPFVRGLSTGDGAPVEPEPSATGLSDTGEPEQ